jgi:hypothetical protein
MTIFVICRLHQSHIYNFKSLWKLWDNIALCLINQHIIKWHDTTKAYLHTMELELYRWRWVVSIGSSCCTPKSVRRTHLTGGWVGQKRKISCPCQDVNPIPQLSKFCAAHHTTWGIPTPSHRRALARLPPRYPFPPLFTVTGNSSNDNLYNIRCGNHLIWPLSTHTRNGKHARAYYIHVTLWSQYNRCCGSHSHAWPWSSSLLQWVH